MVSWVAAPEARFTMPDVVPVRLAALNPRVFDPTVPVIVRLEKVATPEPSVVALALARVPVPDARVAVTTIPAWLTALPLTSSR
jgi:hypothetical protein